MRIRQYLAVFILASLTACAGGPSSKTGNEQPSVNGVKFGTPYEIEGKWYYPRHDPAYDQTGMASWYGNEFHGRKTANGEIFDENVISAAHPTLPMPSIVRVTNLDNGKVLDIRINDRGPYSKKRIIDVSRRGAQALGFWREGTARVRVQMLEDKTQELWASLGRDMPSTIASVPEDLRNIKVEKSREKAVSAPVAEVEIHKSDDAIPLAEGNILQESTPPAKDKKAVSDYVPLNDSYALEHSTAAAPNESSPLVLASLEELPESLPTTAARSSVEPTTSVSRGFYVQVGAFGVEGNAHRMLSSLATVGAAKVIQAGSPQKPLYLVRVGPMENKEKAAVLQQKLASLGHTGSQIVVD